MNIQTSRVPFRLTDINLNFEEAVGEIWLKDERFNLEFQILDALGLTIREDVQYLQIPLGIVKELEVKDWWLTLRLHLRVRPFRALERLPVTDPEIIDLKVPRSGKDALFRLAAETRIVLSGYRQEETGLPAG